MDVVAPSLKAARTNPMRWVVWLPLATLLATASLLIARRLGGALEQPLPTPLLFLVVLLASLTAWATVRTVNITHAAGWSVLCMAAGSLIALGAALSLPGTSGVTLGVLWSSIAATVGLLASSAILRGHTRKPRSSVQASRSFREPISTELAASPADSRSDQSSIEWQRLSRLRTASGEERLEGWVRVDCAAGQRNEVVHLAFCPPFEQTPELETKCSAGPTARCKVTQLLPYAARIEVKLDSLPDEPVSLIIALTAKCPAHARGA